MADPVAQWSYPLSSEIEREKRKVSSVWVGATFPQEEHGHWGKEESFISWNSACNWNLCFLSLGARVSRKCVKSDEAKHAHMWCSHLHTHRFWSGLHICWKTFVNESAGCNELNELPALVSMRLGCSGLPVRSALYIELCLGQLMDPSILSTMASSAPLHQPVQHTDGSQYTTLTQIFQHVWRQNLVNIWSHFTIVCSQ